jgi:hypothetical protein
MRILFDIGHPAHVHLFKNFIRYLSDKNHFVKVVIRERDLIERLLNHYNIPYIKISKAKTGALNMIQELVSRDLKMISLNKTYKFDVAFGVSVSISHLSAVSKVKSYCFADDDDDVVPLYAYLTYPFATKIINPRGIRFKRWANKRVFYDSYQKLAYLHPNNFHPDINILKKYNLTPHKYILVRNSALKAHHDIGVGGINEIFWKQISPLLSGYEVITSRENQKNQIYPWDMHHILNFAKMLLTDSQSMSVEAAVLGVPNIRFNSFAGKISCLEELEKKYDLTYAFLPNQEDKFISKTSELLSIENLKEVWQDRKDKMIHDKVEFNQWLIDFFEQNINCPENK